MSREQLISDAVGRLCAAAGVSTDKQREELQEVLVRWLGNLPAIAPEHAKDDRLYWVRLEDADGKRRAWRSRDRQFPWFVEGFASHYGDSDITVLGEVERDDDTPNHPNHPEVLTTVEDFENAPEWTVIARDHLGPFVKFGGIWRNTLAEVISNELLFYRRDGGSIPVLRWGDSK